MTYLNAFFHMVKFSCVIFHLFSIALQVLWHATHCSRHNTYVFGSILDRSVQAPNTPPPNAPNILPTNGLHLRMAPKSDNLPTPQPHQNLKNAASREFKASLARSSTSNASSIPPCLSRSNKLSTNNLRPPPTPSKNENVDGLRCHKTRHCHPFSR